MERFAHWALRRVQGSRPRTCSRSTAARR
jgi:hypothetical protein